MIDLSFFELFWIFPKINVLRTPKPYKTTCCIVKASYNNISLFFNSNSFLGVLKDYFTYVGLRNARLNFRQFDPGHLMENIIYLELIRRGYSVDVGVVYDRTSRLIILYLHL